MRSKSAQPFTLEDLPEIRRICNEQGRKAYITLNTVMYAHDMQLLKSILDKVKQHKVDAVIAADFAVIEYCWQMKIPLHNIHAGKCEQCRIRSVFFSVL